MLTKYGIPTQKKLNHSTPKAAPEGERASQEMTASLASLAAKRTEGRRQRRSLQGERTSVSREAGKSEVSEGGGRRAVQASREGRPPRPAGLTPAPAG